MLKTHLLTIFSVIVKYSPMFVSSSSSSYVCSCAVVAGWKMKIPDPCATPSLSSAHHNVVLHHGILTLNTPPQSPGTSCTRGLMNFSVRIVVPQNYFKVQHCHQAEQAEPHTCADRTKLGTS